MQNWTDSYDSFEEAVKAAGGRLDDTGINWHWAIGLPNKEVGKSLLRHPWVREDRGVRQEVDGTWTVQYR